MQMDALGEPGTWPDDIWQLGQSDIEKTLDYSFPLYIDDSKLLKVYTFWLVKQIPKLGLKSSFDSSDIIRNGCNFLSARNYDKGVVISAFSKHQPHYLKEYPDGRRQFNYTRRDIEINYKKVSVSASSSSKPSPAQCVCGNSGIGDVFQSTLKISPTSQEENADTDTMDRTKNQLRKLLGMLKQPDSEKWSFDVTPKPSEPAKGVPPAGYVCKRCGIPGTGKFAAQETSNLLMTKSVFQAIISSTAIRTETRPMMARLRRDMPVATAVPLRLTSSLLVPRGNL